MNMQNSHDSIFHPLSRDQILQDLAESRQQIQAGQYTDAKDALQALRSKYGLCCDPDGQGPSAV